MGDAFQSDDAAVAVLLRLWREAQARGTPISPESLCRDDHDLLAPLRQLIGQEAQPLASEDEPTREVRIVSRPATRFRLSGYAIEGELGRGGMSVVYLARRLADQVSVAVKVLLGGVHASESDRRRLADEARIIAQLDHPNIVRTLDVGTQDDQAYLVLEYLPGGSLDRLMARIRMAPMQAVELIETMARAVHFAHESGIIHRDIKPANILLTTWNITPEGTVTLGIPKLADFGLAWEEDSSRPPTRTGAVLGTPGYMAPEQSLGDRKQIGPRADVFSLGVVLYRLLAGKLPFDGRTPELVTRHMRTTRPRKPGSRSANIPPDLDTVCLRALAFDQADRYPTALAFAEDLARIRIGEPIVGQGISRRQWGIAAATSAAIAGGGVYGVHRWLSPVPEPIRAGMLFSLTGPLAVNGGSVAEITQVALRHLNRDGGLLGRPVEPISVDVKSDPTVAAREVARLLDAGCEILFGGWTRELRRAMLPNIEAHGSLLITPGPNLGTDVSPNVVQLGGTPAQLLVPPLRWFVTAKKCRRIYIVGSECEFGRVGGQLARGVLAECAVECVGESRLALGDTRVEPMIRAIEAAKPDLILNLILGGSNTAFFRELPAPPKRATVLSIEFSEQEQRYIDEQYIVGDYSASCYFESLANPQNDQFRRWLRSEQFRHRVPSDGMEAAYAGVRFWAEAVRQARSTVPRVVRTMMNRITVRTPEGRLRLDAASGYAFKTAHVARCEGDGRMRIEWSSPSELPPA